VKEGKDNGKQDAISDDFGADPSDDERINSERAPAYGNVAEAGT